MNRLRNLLFAAAVVLAAGCRDGDRVTSPHSALPGASLRDEAADTAAPPLPAPARPTVFLPPLAAGTPSGAFDAGLAPVVEVCAAADTACAAPVARFTTGGTGSDVVRADAAAGQYVVNWHTGASRLAAGAAYRIRVVVDGTETATRAVTVVASGRDAGGVTDGSFALVNGRTVPIKFWIRKVRRLSVVADAGAEGTPATQDSLYDFGAQVAYAYRAADGFHDLHVSVDGQPAPASGTLSMDRDHTVTVAAEGDVTLPAGAEPLLESARAILTSPDKPAAFQHHLNLVYGVYAGLGVEAGKAHMDSVYAVAYDVVRDSAAIRVAEEALANHVFGVQPEPGAAAAVRRAAGPRLSQAAAGAPHVVYYTVNGIFTNPAGAADNMAAAQVAAEQAHVVQPGDEFRLFYNSSFLHSDQVGLAVHRCFEKALSDHRFLGYVLLIPRLVGCVAEGTLKAILSFDLFEAARQVLNVTGTFPIGAVHDAQEFADVLKDRMAAGENLVIVPHSQGNLLTQEALKVNRERGAAQDRMCIGVVSAAAPVSGHFLLKPGLENGLYVHNDLILMLPFTQGYPQVETDKSRDAERTWNRWYWRWLGLRTPVMLFERFKLHSFADSYLGASQSRNVVTGLMAGERRTLLALPECAPRPVASVEVVPAISTLDPGGTVHLAAEAKDSSGNVLTGRAVTWTTSDASVATVSAGGDVTAKDGGSATITATVDGVEGHGTVNVTAAPPPQASDTLPVGATSGYVVTVPASGQVSLSFDARIDNGGTAGNSTVLEVTVNGQPVTDAMLTNKGTSYTYPNRGGTEPYFANRGAAYGQPGPLWGLFWSPDWTSNDGGSDYYAVSTGQPYTFAFDVSGLVQPGQRATVVLRNHAEWLRDLTGLQPVIILRNVTIDTQ